MGRTTHYIGNLPFVVDPNSITLNSGRQIDWDNVPDSYRQGAFSVVVDTAGAAIDDVAVPVVALTGAIDAGTNLYFGGAKKLARVTAAAAVGDTSLTVEALPTALVSTDTAVVGGSGAKLITAGLCVAQMASGKVVPRADIPGSETAIGFLATNAIEGDNSQALSGFGVIVGGVLYENLLPDAVAGNLPAGYITELIASKVSTGFAFEDYGDNR